MVELSESILIDCCLEDVFRFISNYKNDTKWRGSVIEMLQFPEYNTFAGTKTIETIKLFGQKQFVYAEVCEFENNKKVSFMTTESLIKVKGSREVSRENSYTKFTYSLSAELTGVYKLFAGLIKNHYRKRVLNDLIKIKSLLEENK
ncbi:MAG: hypothetical protein HC831_31565 [Chloroflexia bacterium]|nr:hypothetical protein [Chloroflexia bacterium]